MKCERHIVDRVDILGGDYRRLFHIAEQGNLRSQIVRQRSIGTTQKNLRSNSDLSQLAHGMLRGFRLQLAGSRNERHQRRMYEQSVLASFFIAHLANSFEKRQRFNVADGAANLDDYNVRVSVDGDRANRVFDFVRDVRNHLNRLAEIIPTTFFLDHRKINATRRPVVCL